MKILKTIAAGTCALALVGCDQQRVQKVTEELPLVRVGAVQEQVPFTEGIRVQGMLRAKETASLAARVPGVLEGALAEEGVRVKKGDVLFRTDSINLGNAVRAAENDLALARARLKQTEAASAKAALDKTRLKRLLDEKAVTRDAYEKADVAALTQAAAVEAARAGVAKAETGLAIAHKNQADAAGVAPFDALVVKKVRHTGEYVGPGAAVFTLEDPTCYEVCLTLNAAEYPRVIVGKTAISVRALGKAFPVTYKASTVDTKVRTFEVRAVLTKTDAIASGMLLDCEVIFARRTSQAVPASAVAQRDGGECVFKVAAGKVVRVGVTCGVRQNGLCEILQPHFAATDRIVTAGMLLLNAGDAVRTCE